MKEEKAKTNLKNGKKLKILVCTLIVFLIALILIMIKTFYNKNKVSGLIQIPYLLWTLFADYLNLSIYLLNR